MANSKIDLSDPHLEEVAKIFSMLGEPSRLKIIRALMAGVQTVSDLVRLTGMKQGNVSKHLGLLLTARIVARYPEGNFARYELVDPVISDLCRAMCSRIENDAARRVRELGGG